jgi:hypothetical protein
LCDAGNQFVNITAIISDFRGLSKSLLITYAAQHQLFPVTVVPQEDSKLFHNGHLLLLSRDI